jgi:hypothetical protein
MSDIATTNQPLLRDALEQIRPEMSALSTDDLIPINIDPVAATGIARGSLPRIMKYREQLVSEVPKFDLSNLDKLGTYALALIQAQTAYGIATTPPEVLASLAEEAAKLRDLLYSDAAALGKRGLLNPAPLNDLKGPAGYRNTATDVLGLALLLRNHLDKIAAKTCVTLAELDRAEVVGQQLLDAVGVREQSPAKVEQATVERQQAYTLFVNAYDQVRRAIGFLRWNDNDADDIAPSLYGGRTTSRKKNASDVQKTAETAATPANPVVTATTTTTSTTATAPVTKTVAGLPGADPFAS